LTRIIDGQKLCTLSGEQLVKHALAKAVVYFGIAVLRLDARTRKPGERRIIRRVPTRQFDEFAFVSGQSPGLVYSELY